MTLSARSIEPGVPGNDRVLPREMLWIAIAMPPVLFLLLDPEALAQPLDAVLRSVANIAIYTTANVVLIHALFEVVLPRLGVRLAAPARVVLCGALLAVLVTAMTFAIAPLLDMVCGGMAETPTRLATQGVVIAWMYVSAGLVMRAVRERLAAARERAQAERAAAAEARLRALTARTNPHFLFNSLNAGMSLIATDPERAEELLGRLSSLFRYALDGSSRGDVPLEEELDAVRDYLEIERARFGERLNVELEVDPSLLAVRVPPLVLQPLAENAVLHGIAPRVAGGRLRVRVRREAARMTIEVEDDGAGPARSSHRGSGTALADLRERLALVYGAHASLETSVAGELGGFRAAIHIPLS